MRSLPFTTAAAADVTHLGWLLEMVPVGLPPVYLNTIGADYSDSSTSPATVYLGDPGFIMGSVRVTDGKDPPSLDVRIPVGDTGPIDPDNVTRGLYNGAAVVVRAVDYANGDVSPPIGFRWSVGTVKIANDGKTIFELRADTRIQRELILKILTPQCTADWGDSRCGVNPAPFTDTVEIDSVSSLYEFTVTGSARADGFFDNGAIKFTSGENVGRAYTVRKWTLSTRKILLWEPLRATPAIGDDGTVHAGCDKTRTMCHSKFNNIARFQGFADMPGDDAVFSFESPEAESTPLTPEPTVTVTEETVDPPSKGPFLVGGSW